MSWWIEATDESAMEKGKDAATTRRKRWEAAAVYFMVILNVVQYFGQCAVVRSCGCVFVELCMYLFSISRFYEEEMNMYSASVITRAVNQVISAVSSR